MSQAGAGPLYPKTPAGLAAAEQPVHVPDGADEDTDAARGVAPDAGPATGERQAAENRENDPPA